MNVVVVAPHPDDEAIGCGGAICTHADRGDRVAVVFLTSGELGLRHLEREAAWRVREGEAAAAAEVLGAGSVDFLRFPDWYLGEHVERAGQALARVLARHAPTCIYLPHSGEWHPDHQAATPVVAAALGSLGLDASEIALRGYEVWTPLAQFDHVEDISAVFDRKLAAVGCYPSQLRSFRYDRAVRGLNQYRGALAARCDYAEVFSDAAPPAPAARNPANS